MKKTLLTFVLPIVVILIGIGLVIGSFHVQTKMAATRTPVAAQSYSSDSAASTGQSSSGKQAQNHNAAKNVTKTDQNSSVPNTKNNGSGTSREASETVSSPSTSSSKSSTSKDRPAATNGTAATSSQATTNTTGQSGTSNQTVSSDSSSSSATSEKQVSYAIQGLNGFSAQGSVTYRSGDSAFSELQRFTQAKGIQLGYSGFGSSIYVSSINNQKAGQVSPTSGWTYSVNGKQPNISAGAYQLRPNDKVVWYYTK